MEESIGEIKHRLPVEVYFLRYAFPCAFVAKERNEISEEEYKNLEVAALQGFTLARPILERIFHNAFYYIKNLAKSSNRDKWDYDMIEEYFMSYHNKLIDDREGNYATASETIRDLSKVKFGKVMNIKDDILEVLFEDGKIRNVLNHFVPYAKIGDKVSVHYGYAVEIF